MPSTQPSSVAEAGTGRRALSDPQARAASTSSGRQSLNFPPPTATPITYTPPTALTSFLSIAHPLAPTSTLIVAAAMRLPTSTTATTAAATLLSLLTLAQAWTLTVQLPAAPQLPAYNPSALPSTTQATLYARGRTHTALLSKRNAFAFADLAPGAYLLTVQCRDFAFPPARVDVNGSYAAASGAPQAAKVDVWQTFWGNEWRNRGEWRGGGVAEDARSGEVVVDVFPVRQNEYYTERAGFSVLSFLKNPMILMGLFSLVLIVGMPMLMDSMDEETKAEFEEMQKHSSPTSNAAQSFQNFDLAGWMAGKSSGGSAAESSKAK